MFVTTEDDTGRTVRRFSGWVLLADVLGVLLLVGLIGAAAGATAFKALPVLFLIGVPLLAVIVGFSPSEAPQRAPETAERRAPVRITVIRYPGDS